MAVDGFDPGTATHLYGDLQHMDQDSVKASLAVIEALLPARVLGNVLTHHPQLLGADMCAWREFLLAFGFSDDKIQQLLRACPEVFYRSQLFAAGQLLLFLRQDLQLPQEAVMQHFKWAAVLSPGATQESMRAVTAALQQQLGLGGPDPERLLALLQAFPEVLGWSVERELAPRLAFFEGLGPEGQRLLAGSLWDAEGTGWLPGLRSWAYSVAPKLQLLEQVLGSEEQALQLVSRCPTVLKLPVESKLQPLLAALSALGLDGDQVAALLRGSPRLLAESKDALVSRINFLLDAIGGTADDLAAYPGYALLSLEDVIGPRFYFLARHPGWCDAFSDPVTGSLALRRVMEPPLHEFLGDVAQVTGTSRNQVDKDYQQMTAEWANMLGWCCEKAFSSLDQATNSLYSEQLNLFYVLLQ